VKRGNLITIGSFDGVHLGHQALLARTCHEAQKRGLKSMAFTFAIPPKMVLDSAHALRLLSDAREKETLLRSFGMDEVVFWKFTQQTSTLRPFAFLRNILIERFKARGIVVGADFRFGAERAAGVHELVRWGQEFEIPVWVIPAVRRHGHVISSSVIRHLLETHKIKKAAGLLGHPYLLAGRVVRGKQRGRRLGFRTANITPTPGKVLPHGVFAVKAWLNNRPKFRYDGVCNIGVRPTLESDATVNVETHLFDISENLLGKILFVELHHFLRAEKKFASPAELGRQIALDVKRARAKLAA
jgi:riboflavin kinase/FMN adenylyltransferase